MRQAADRVSPKLVTSLACVAVLLASGFYQAGAEESTAAPGPLRFEGYPDAPEVDVVPRKDELFFYPCDQCHADIEANPEIRPLDAPHDGEIEHGRGRIWCMSCHALENRNDLHTLLEEPVDFDDAHVVCAGCHSSQHKDWAFGAHGKRVDTWQGQRTQYNCTHCHDAHSPAIKARAPEPAPPARAGLELKPGSLHQARPAWESGDAEHAE